MDDNNVVNSGNTNISDSSKDDVKNDSVGSDKSKGNHGGGKRPIFEKIADRLEDVTKYASQSLTNAEVAQILDISESSFYRLMAEPEFKAAYEKGIDNRKYELEKALFKRAEGFTAQEVKIETDEKGNVTKKIVTDKHYVPDSTALIFALKNVYSDKYKDRIESVNTVNINVSQIQNLPDEELLKYVGTELLDNADYVIE